LQEKDMLTTLIVLGLVLAAAGFLACLLPVLPGPALSFAGLLLFAVVSGWQAFDVWFIVSMGVAAVVVSLLDYAVGILGAKKFGASKWGLLGSIVGMLAGLFFFPPFGMFLGAVLGAVGGELLSGKKSRAAIRAGWGVLVGNILGTGVKLAYCAVVLFVYIKALF
jgi:uncharacterized protein